MDLLSRLLALTPVTGRLEVRCHFGAPWRLDEPAAPEREVPYHVLLAGEAVVEGAGGVPRVMRAGDVVLFPGGAAHALHDGSGERPRPVRRESSDYLRVANNDGGGAPADILCGRFVLPAASLRLVQSLLPERVIVSARPAGVAPQDVAATRLARLVALMREESLDQAPGSETLVGHFSAALFALALRFASAAADAPPGLLALGRHPRLQPAVLAMFDTPQRPWTLPDLATQANMSRATLARLFEQAIGRSPAQVLAEIRMAHAARALTEGRRSVADIGEAVGYFSDAAFQRAFKTRMGMTPARWRVVHGHAGDVEDRVGGG